MTLVLYVCLTQIQKASVVQPAVLSTLYTYEDCLWLVGNMDAWIVGSPLGFRVRQICAWIRLCHLLAFELGHWCGRYGTSLMNNHYLFLVCGYCDGDALWPLTFPASLSNAVCSWSGTLALLEQGHLISWFIFDKWAVFDKWPMFLSIAWRWKEWVNIHYLS